MDKCLLLVQLTLGVELGALVEDTSASGTGTSTDQVGQDTTTETRVDVGGVTGVGGLVAARELSLVTTLGLSLLHSHVVRDRELDIGVALVVDAVGVASTAGVGAGGVATGRQGSNGASKAEDKSGQSELHCVCGVGVERERLGDYLVF